MKAFFVLLVLAMVPQDAPDAPTRESQRAAERAVDAPDRDTQRTLVENLGKLLRGFQDLGPWEEHYGLMINAVERVYERNQWNSESDRFSLEVIREVESLPPLAIQQRFDTFINLFSDRYLLDENQEQSLRRLIARESNAVFVKHSGRILGYALEAIQTRAAGEPFTPDQVARWTQQAGPVFDEAKGAMQRVADEFNKQLDPQQQQLVRTDLDAAHRRLGTIDKMRQSWARGEWKPEQWGLDHDPIQMGGDVPAAGAEPRTASNPNAAASPGQRPAAKPSQPASPTAPPVAVATPNPGSVSPPGAAGPAAGGPQGTPAAGPKGTPAAGGSNPGADDPWARYVRAFVDKFKLNADQQQRAWTLYDEVKPRADTITKRYAERAKSVQRTHQGGEGGPADAAVKAVVAKEQSELERLFQQMKRQLDRLPTRAQRKEAPPGDIPPPVAITAAASTGAAKPQSPKPATSSGDSKPAAAPKSTPEQPAPTKPTSP
ncbi:MAG: hypothetical protein AB7Q17_13150 [Phycisphaerae bacterium]